jgi:hypothetical protein
VETVVLVAAVHPLVQLAVATVATVELAAMLAVELAAAVVADLARAPFFPEVAAAVVRRWALVATAEAAAMMVPTAMVQI